MTKIKMIREFDGMVPCCDALRLLNNSGGLAWKLQRSRWHIMRKLVQTKAKILGIEEEILATSFCVLGLSMGFVLSIHLFS